MPTPKYRIWEEVYVIRNNRIAKWTIEKIERSICELTTTGSSHTKYTRDIE